MVDLRRCRCLQRVGRMTITQLFKRFGLPRFVLLCSALLLASLFAGRASAADFSQCSNTANTGGGSIPYCPTLQEAYTYAYTIADGLNTHGYEIGMLKPQCSITPQTNPLYDYQGTVSCSYRTGFGNNSSRRRYAEGCPAGTEWFASLQKCDKPCSARNADLGGTAQPIKWASSNASQCIAECKYQIVSDQQTRTVTATVGGSTATAGTLYGGRWEYTGDRCPASPAPLPIEDAQPKTECTPAANGQTYCLRPSGDACATSSAGRMICWRPGETGIKTDGTVTQTNTQGQESPSPPPGSTHTATTNVTTTTNTNISTSTINNYTTNDGSPAGSTNDGTSVGSDGKPSAGGSGSGSGSGGDGDGNSSGGGGDCASPPVSSGDALLAQIAHQAWATRCAISDRNKAQDDQAAELAGQGDGLDGVTEESIFHEFEAGDLREDLLGSSAGTCSFGVPLELMGHPIELPPSFWSLASWIGMLVVASAYLWVAHKLGG